MILLFLFVLGAVIGSFIGALTWRWPRNTSIFDGRSRCPSCNHIIRPYDNIPLFSYLFLGGRCRDCKKKIPRRDFVIETSVAILFPVFYLAYPLVSDNLFWLTQLPALVGLTVFYFILSMCVAIFIIDLEHQYIPDTLVFVMLFAVVGIFIVQSNSQIFMHIASGLGAGVFLLLVHLVTRGRGMGLGDVKLVLALCTILGFPLAVVSMFSAFILGSIIGLILIIFRVAKLKQKIAFGPFLIAAFFLSLVSGHKFLEILYI